MFKLLQKIRQVAKYKVERIQRNTQIIRNVNLLLNHDLVKNHRVLGNAMKFIVNNDMAAAEMLTAQLEIPEIKVTHILAEDTQGIIGDNQDKAGKLCWNSPEDMAHFVKNTKGKVCIVGGVTFRSFGSRVLRDRGMIVITTNKQTIERVTALSDHYAVSSIEEALQLASMIVGVGVKYPKDIMIIGGAAIYKQTLNVVTDVLLSKINVVANGNVVRDWVYPKHVNVKQYNFEGTVN